MSRPGQGSNTSPTYRQSLAIFLLFFFIQLFVYRHVFAIRPAADDYILALQIRIGEEAGPLKFFTSSLLLDYRPLQSLTCWVVGRWAIDDPFLLIHILNFASFIFYVVVFGLWTRLTRLPLIPVLCAASFVFLHPVFAGPLADLDNFTRLVVSAWVWLGVYFAYTNAHRLSLAIPLVSACFVIGLGFMEYGIGLLPLSILAIAWRRQRDRVRGALAIGAALFTLFVGYYCLRLSVSGSGGAFLSPSPITWVKNFLMLGTSVLFMGNTISVYVHTSMGALVALAISIAVMGAMLLAGLVTWYQHSRVAAETVSAGQLFEFLGLALPASFVPMIFMKHVSEIYASAIVIPLALYIGYAAAGWLRWTRPRFVVVLLTFALHIAWACTSVTAKVADRIETGQRAEAQLHALLRWIPGDARGLRVALVFVESELPPRRTYSVFRVGDDHLIQPGVSALAALQWVRPAENIEIHHLIVQNRSEVQAKDFGLVLYWNPRVREFEPLKE